MGVNLEMTSASGPGSKPLSAKVSRVKKARVCHTHSPKSYFMGEVFPLAGLRSPASGG